MSNQYVVENMYRICFIQQRKIILRSFYIQNDPMKKFQKPLNRKKGSHLANVTFLGLQGDKINEQIFILLQIPNFEKF